jgi:hypothetical protein
VLADEEVFDGLDALKRRDRMSRSPWKMNNAVTLAMALDRK